MNETTSEIARELRGEVYLGRTRLYEGKAADVDAYIASNKLDRSVVVIKSWVRLSGNRTVQLTDSCDDFQVEEVRRYTRVDGGYGQRDEIGHYEVESRTLNHGELTLTLIGEKKALVSFGDVTIKIEAGGWDEHVLDLDIPREVEAHGFKQP